MLRRRHEIGQHRAEERDGSSDAAGAVRNSGTVQSHLDPCQGAAQHQIVEMPEVADAEHLAAQFAETGAERHVKALENDLPYPVGVEPVRNDDRGQRVRMLARIGAQDFETPAGDSPPCRLGVAGVAGGTPPEPPPMQPLAYRPGPTPPKHDARTGGSE